MNISRTRFVMGVLWLSFAYSVWAQEGTVNRNVILRRDPLTASPMVNHLASGARVALVDATADSSFFHVNIEDDRVGWVWSRYVMVSSTASPLLAARISTPPPD